MVAAVGLGLLTACTATESPVPPPATRPADLAVRSSGDLEHQRRHYDDIRSGDVDDDPRTDPERRPAGPRSPERPRPEAVRAPGAAVRGLD